MIVFILSLEGITNSLEEEYDEHRLGHYSDAGKEKQAKKLLVMVVLKLQYSERVTLRLKVLSLAKIQRITLENQVLFINEGGLYGIEGCNIAIGF
ncbi:hypothetical protein WISP_62238 [Willisornis vidua]|uniref:Uncharacterized protein n=1 Tax=Willisornis vidua TaxID=1566151 RepID=A0ABQ9DET4_9PASS|nr:hypothetical protein WISP_62238 [Willisornis vidua]